MSNIMYFSFFDEFLKIAAAKTPTVGTSKEKKKIKKKGLKALAKKIQKKVKVSKNKASVTAGKGEVVLSGGKKSVDLGYRRKAGKTSYTGGIRASKKGVAPTAGISHKEGDATFRASTTGGIGKSPRTTEAGMDIKGKRGKVGFTAKKGKDFSIGGELQRRVGKKLNLGLSGKAFQSGRQQGRLSGTYTPTKKSGTFGAHLGYDTKGGSRGGLSWNKQVNKRLNVGVTADSSLQNKKRFAEERKVVGTATVRPDKRTQFTGKVSALPKNQAGVDLGMTKQVGKNTEIKAGVGGTTDKGVTLRGSASRTFGKGLLGAKKGWNVGLGGSHTTAPKGPGSWKTQGFLTRNFKGGAFGAKGSLGTGSSGKKTWSIGPSFQKKF